MRYFGLFFNLTLLFLTSCAPVVKPTRIYPYNVDLLASSIKKLDVPIEKFTPADRVGIISIEFGEPVDFPVNYLIEDNLLRKLFEANVKILERDPDVFPVLFSESKENFQYCSKGAFDALSQLPSSLKTATKVLAYRVLECGVTTELIGKEERKEKPIIEVKIEVFGKKVTEEKIGGIKRTAYTSLSARIIDTKTSAIVWSGNLTGEAIDTVPINIYPTLGNRNLWFYSHGLPNKEFIKIKSPLITELVTPEKTGFFASLSKKLGGMFKSKETTRRRRKK